MSPQCSGGMYSTAKLAALVMALLVSQVAANPAIVVSTVEDGQHDVALKISHIELMPGISSWDDLGFLHLGTPSFSQYHGDMDIALWEQLAVIDVASGTLCQHTDGCMEDIALAYQRLCDDEASYLEDGPVESAASDVLKRAEDAAQVRRYIALWSGSRNWVHSHIHTARAVAVGTLADAVAALTTTLIDTGRNSFCHTTNGNKACLSWSGAAHLFAKNYAKQIIDSAKGDFGGDAVSGKETGTIFDNLNEPHNVCVSNRPDGCT